MKKFYLLLLLLIHSYAYSQEIQREFSVNTGQLFKLQSTIGGSISVKGEGQGKIRVAITHNGGDEFKFDFQESAQGVTLLATGPKNWRENTKIDFQVTVPENFNLDLSTSGGNIELQNIKGNLNGRTSGGNLVVNQTEGAHSLKTSGGNIAIHSSSGEGSVSTSGGNIAVNTLSGKFSLLTSGGNIVLESSKLEGDVRTSGGNIVCKNTEINGEVKTSGGNITVDKAPQGISVATSGGNIQINSANTFAEAKTSGGNITITEVDGWITAHTSGGNVTARMVGDPSTGKRDVELLSSGGTLTLTVPEGLGMNIEIETNYNTRNNWGKEPEIKSDFEISTRKEDKGNMIHLYGSGQVGDGKNTIRLKTTGGSVYLKKG